MRKIIILSIVLSSFLFVSAQTKAEIDSTAGSMFLADYKFWFGFLAAIFSVISLILALKSNNRSKNTENRALTEDKTKNEAALFLFLCESAASKSEEIRDRAHPEYRELSTSLEIGKTEDRNYSVCYIKSYFQVNPLTIHDRTHTSTWEKWYLGIEKFESPFHIYAFFGELPKLLKRPGDVSFEIEDATPEWIRSDFGKRERIFCIKFNEVRTF